ncbi:MAG: Crp/Fnr family transcriptional regulator [Acidobacteriaceae bacterium]|nr:Crp/Fnr family transcriptional regulator [Acidobacteriaceae bacterium]
MTSLSNVARSALGLMPDVTRLNSLRRSTSLFSQGQVADALYIIEDGLVKLTRTSESQSRIILMICGAGFVIGEEALAADSQTYYAEAEVLAPAAALRVPRETLTRVLASTPELAEAMTAAVVRQKRALAEKIELLCLHDVEYRILHYLADLASLVKPGGDSEPYQLPITQLELADLVGATRETTSTTLNQLERRGLVQLSRRLLTIPSPASLRAAAVARGATNGRAVPAMTGSV